MSWGRTGLRSVGCWLRNGFQLRIRILVIACASTRHVSPSFSVRQQVAVCSSEWAFGHGSLSPTGFQTTHSLQGRGACSVGRRFALAPLALLNGCKCSVLLEGADGLAIARSMGAVPRGNGHLLLGQMFKTGCQRFQTGQSQVARCSKLAARCSKLAGVSSYSWAASSLSKLCWGRCPRHASTQ